MKTILIAAMLVAAPALAAENGAAKAEDAIKAAFAQFDTCIAKQDTNCVGDIFTDDVTFAGPTGGGKFIKGKAETINALQGMMNRPAMKGVEQKHTVQNVRLIGQDRALVDCAVELVGMKSTADASEPSWQTWHTTAVLLLKGGKWLVEDIRTYVVEPARSSSTPVRLPMATPAQPNVPVLPPVPTPAAQPNVPEQPAVPPKT